jgi:circadian clock protein KaiC
MAIMPVPSGLSGLDDVLCGGLPEGRTTVVAGGPGSGKTMLGMQFLAAGSGCGEPGIMLSFEESREKLMTDFGAMAFPHVAAIGTSIEIIDGRPTDDTTINGSFDLTGLIATLSAFNRHHGTRRLVIDAIDVLFSLREQTQETRREIVRLLSWLQEARITTLLTVKTRHANGLPDTFGFAEFAADGVIQLRSSMHGNLLQRTVRIIKLRGSSFVTGDHPYDIGNRGLRVLSTPARTRADESAGNERCTTGIERLDRMLDGGYLRGSMTLISGLPGTSKTTFGASFLSAGCARGERCLFVGFDEPAEQMVANVRSIGIELGAAQRDGLLRIESFSAGATIADRLLIIIEDLIEEHQPKRVVIDPLSAWIKSGGTKISDSAIERLVSSMKRRGLTVVMTAISESGSSMLESTLTRVSTIADTWIHLSYASHAGERNRTLTIVKSRGTDHSGQMREVILGKDGVSLTDVYVGEGDVLFGTARFQHEQALIEEAHEKQSNLARMAHKIEDERAALVVRIARLDERSAEMLAIANRERASEQMKADQLSDRRGADPEPVV